MARSTVEVELIAQVAEANKTVKRFADDTQKQLNGINFNSSVAAISSGFQPPCRQGNRRGKRGGAG